MYFITRVNLDWIIIYLIAYLANDTESWKVGSILVDVKLFTPDLTDDRVQELTRVFEKLVNKYSEKRKGIKMERGKVGYNILAGRRVPTRIVSVYGEKFFVPEHIKPFPSGYEEFGWEVTYADRNSSYWNLNEAIEALETFMWEETISKLHLKENKNKKYKVGVPGLTYKYYKDDKKYVFTLKDKNLVFTETLSLCFEKDFDIVQVNSALKKFYLVKLWLTYLRRKKDCLYDNGLKSGDVSEAFSKLPELFIKVAYDKASDSINNNFL